MSPAGCGRGREIAEIEVEGDERAILAGREREDVAVRQKALPKISQMHRIVALIAQPHREL